MSVINPFNAIRPDPTLVTKVATHSVERYTKEQIKEILATNPVSFLQVIHPVENPLQIAEDRLLSIKKRFKEFVSKNIFIRDSSPCFYVYRQIKNGRHHTGIIGLASVNDYNNNVIKIHEQTLAQREEKLKEYLDVCEFNAEPVCLTYPHNKGLNDFMQAKMNDAPLYDYTSHGVRHTVWIIDKSAEIEHIQSAFKKVPAMYIADGHHRAASSARLAKMKKESNLNHTGNEPYNFFTAALFADDELTIFGYHRLVKDLNGLSIYSLLTELRKKFEVMISEKPGESIQKETIYLYTRHQWYCIDLKKTFIDSNDPVSALDVSKLSDYVLSPILGIKDIRNDKRISFVPGIKSSEEIEAIVNSGKADAAFCLSPVIFEELIAVADSGKEMPPKSTWIEPKLESGLLIYSLEK